ncbi:tRNA (adenosine(37)-N6)-threonylcarbamoyltransferase complex dimerization subunit type 1 TsaB [Blattabacterium cuenoti]|uniref:tRNA (adenosine(37)-N6)-threonylcarbamoyltransferase complex dimerization subunit type 1 TsaB n=1 Tax=Blattabacterium cuenoti TaxID=1653831 RepID=UPI00163D2BF9|nr:tRNA (adenosine(37)-N6)-threonylcarbamoyltransferase complex dimerization subunit type 1 TsaB [Blattabacterium cuenoti]
MSLILNLETSTKNCSVSISNSGKCLVSLEEYSKQYLHIEKLHIFIENAIKISKINLTDLQSICVSKGPGSYSSLRVGVNAAKGFCISLGIPLLSVDSLTVIIQSINVKNGYIHPMIHAKSDFFYTSMFDKYKNRLSPICLKNINDIFPKKEKNEEKNIYIGNVDFFSFNSFNKEFIKNKKNFIPNTYPSAKNMSLISYIKFNEKKFNKIEKFFPFYL